VYVPFVTSFSISLLVPRGFLASVFNGLFMIKSYMIFQTAPRQQASIVRNLNLSYSPFIASISYSADSYKRCSLQRGFKIGVVGYSADTLGYRLQRGFKIAFAVGYSGDHIIFVFCKNN
jgi:hypothetical protein